MYAVMANRGHSGVKPAPPTVTLPLPLPVDGSKPLAGKRAGVYWKVGTRGSGACLEHTAHGCRRGRASI